MLLIIVASLWSPKADADLPPGLESDIERARAALTTGELDQTQRTAATRLLDEAAKTDQEADTLAQRIATLKSEATDAPAQETQWREALTVDRQQALRQWEERLPSDADPETLEQFLLQEQTASIQLRTDIDTTASKLADAISRPSQATNDITQLQQRIAERAATAPVDEGEPATLREARRLHRDAALRHLQAELELRQTEQDTASLRQRLLELSLRAQRHQLAQREPRIAILRQRIADLRRNELEMLAARVSNRAAELAEGDSTNATEAAHNQTLATELVDTNETLAAERETLAEQQRAQAQVAFALRDTQTRLDLGATNEALGRWLWSERRKLAIPSHIESQLAQLRSMLGALRLRLVSLTDEQRDLIDLPAAVEQTLERSHASSDDEALVTADDQTLGDLLNERAELLDRLEPLLRHRIATLEQSERVLQDQLHATLELRQMLDRHLLWIPSHEPVGLSWLSRVPAGLYDLVKPSRFVTTGQLIARSLSERPFAYLGSALTVLVLLLVRRRGLARIDAVAAATRSVRKDTYAGTIETLGWTVVAALPWAVSVWLLGQLLQDVGQPGKYSDSLGRALAAIALPIFTFQFLRWANRDRGLAAAHFRWSRPRRDALRRWLPITMWLMVGAYFVIALAFIRNQDLAIDVQARLALVLMSVSASLILWRLLAPSQLWTPRGVAIEPSKTRRALRGLLPLSVLTCTVLAATGYVYSSGMLIASQFASVGVIIAVAVLYGLLARWFLLGARRLALRRWEQRRDAEASSADTDTGEAMPDLDEDITLETVDVHSRRLLRALKLTLLFFGLLWVWADLLPAFARLDEITLWYFSDTGPDGGTVRAPVTLIAVLIGTLVLALTTVAARNLPGLIEIGLLSRSSIDAASRYAITSVLRYAIVITGILVGVGLFGLRWSQLQWMAAALTVGLGFGLQEIFANFVSGLILLFERPFRVGDVITIGDLSGTVTRIRTRATTILDFDNKEIVVPNKTFITDQLVNWTLSDTTTRVTIKVGVAYGSDVAKVHALLMQVARENPRVLDAPPPNSWLLNFGASSLDFELRIFVGTLADRLAVQNEINGRIAEVFAQAGIEIAFPQVDLHVRDLPPSRPEESDSRASASS